MRVYLNTFGTCGGDRVKTRTLAHRFREEITITTRCQMARLRLFCPSDALLNALTLTQVASAFMVDDVDVLIARRVNEFHTRFYA